MGKVIYHVKQTSTRARGYILETTAQTEQWIMQLQDRNRIHQVLFLLVSTPRSLQPGHSLRTTYFRRARKWHICR